jgi:hypothetical protein
MKKLWWTVLVLCGLAAIFCAAYPMYVIQPFRPQGAAELNLALLTIRARPVMTLLCLGAVGFAAMRLWRATVKWPARVALAAAVVAACASAVAARVNVFEMMFHPVENPAFEPVAQVKLDTDEKVLAIRPKGVARAYPVRAIAYHHVVNDLVGGIPIVATY